MSSDQPVIREATIEDAKTLTEFNCNLALESENITLNPAVVLRGVEAVFENSARGFYLVAETNNTVVASLLVTKEWSDWRNGELWWVQSVYVVEEWRRQGMFRALYQSMRQLAKQHSTPVCGVRLYVERENHVAQKTYAAMGMDETNYKMFEDIPPSTNGG